MKLLLTETQIMFLKGAIIEREMNESIGLPDENGYIPISEKEILQLNEFLLTLEPNDVIIIERNNGKYRHHKNQDMPILSKAKIILENIEKEIGSKISFKEIYLKGIMNGFIEIYERNKNSSH